jgi:hypothetical protein
MSTVTDIEAAVRKPSPKELSAFRAWFTEFDAEAWDKQLEKDVAAGRLNGLAGEALRDFKAGRFSER